MASRDEPEHATAVSDAVARPRRALISVLSLGIVAPIVACYLLYDWDKMIATIDNWIPPAHQETVRALAREVDKTISGFVRGQSSLCLVLAVYYAVALRLVGLDHGILIGIAAGLISFIPYLDSFSGLVIGFLGLLIAVPVAAAIGVLMRFALRTYYASSLYAPAAIEPKAQPRDPGARMKR